MAKVAIPLKYQSSIPLKCYARKHKATRRQGVLDGNVKKARSVFPSVASFTAHSQYVELQHFLQSPLLRLLLGNPVLSPEQRIN